MSKATITFDLSNQIDKKEHKRVMKADEMASILWEMTHNKREKIKERISSEKEEYLIDLIFDEFDKEMEDNNINIDEIWE